MILNHGNRKLNKISKKSLADKRDGQLSPALYFLYIFSASHLLPLLPIYVTIVYLGQCSTHKNLLMIKLTTVDSRKKYSLNVCFDTFHEARETSPSQAPWSSHIRVDSSLVVPRSSFDLGIFTDLALLILSHFSCLLRSVQFWMRGQCNLLNV